MLPATMAEIAESKGSCAREENNRGQEDHRRQKARREEVNLQIDNDLSSG